MAGGGRQRHAVGQIGVGESSLSLQNGQDLTIERVERRLR